ncbi:MAG: hypothetical protein J6B89_04475 [Bacilli bacterium]|nr:hypothetical protein [Bacilli bacterium]
MTDKKRNILIVALFVAIVAMSVGYAALAQVLNINGTANIAAKWNVEITDIQVKQQVGATDRVTPSYTSKTATFDVNLAYPGASSTYLVTVKNSGTINAKLSEITGVDAANLMDPTAVQYTVVKSDENDELNVGESKTFEVRVEWLSTDDGTNITASNKTAEINFNYVQNQ